MRKKQNIIRPMLTHQTVARRRFTAEIKFKPNHYEYNRLNYIFISDTGANPQRSLFQHFNERSPRGLFVFRHCKISMIRNTPFN